MKVAWGYRYNYRYLLGTLALVSGGWSLEAA